MQTLLFDKGTYPKVAFLIKESAINYQLLDIHYIQKLNCSVLAYPLKYNPANKLPAAFAKEYLQYLLPEIKNDAIKTILVADSGYFKFLTKKNKAEPYYGDVLPCAIKGYEDINVILTTNYQALFHNPGLEARLVMGIHTCNDYLEGNFLQLGQNIIHTEYYPDNLEAKRNILAELLNYKALTCDIETYGLDLAEADLATIAFAWDQHNGIAFKVDEDVKPLLKQFFESYQGKLIFHNASFDVRNIIYRCFMEHSLDIEGMVYGLQCMYRNLHDTKLIVYLSTNSTAGNTLSLKHNAFEFAGNYAVEDIDDVTKIPDAELLRYNLVDCLSTWYVYNKFYPKMVAENQEPIYKDLFLPALRNVTNMELVGMPMDMETIDKLDQELTDLNNKSYTVLRNSPTVKAYEWQLQREAFLAANHKLKRKVRSLDEFKTEFMPSSNQQLAGLLFNHIGFDVIDTTDTGLPATGKDVLKKLFNHLVKNHNINEDEL